MTQQEIDAMSEALRSQGLTWGQTNFAVSLVRNAVAAERERLQRQNEVLRAERDHERAKVANSVRLLIGIHSLMYPAPIKIEDGRTMVFRPKDPDPHTVLQELSDRIRAIQDEIVRL